jgi:imidazolonepropionase-like amidohydrolase
MTSFRAAIACLTLSIVSSCVSSCAHAPVPAPAPAAEERTIAFVDVNVVPLDSERVVGGQTVLVRAGSIVAVGPSSNVTVPAHAQVVDGRGKYLMPGLADMHTHLVREEDLLLYVARGVTTVRNMWGAPVHLAWRDRIRRGALVGPTIVTAGPIVDGEDPTHDGSLIVRNAQEAKVAIALHQRAGYDFVKIYSDLSLPAFAALMTAAKSAGLPVVGHVPRPVGLARAVDEGQHSIEHLSAFSEALQKDDSPVAGKFDRASRARKLDFIDEAKLAPLVEHLRTSGAWVCPTRVVWSLNDSPEALKQRLARPEMKYVGPFELAIWKSELDRSPEQIAADARTNAFGDRVLAALHDGHASLLVGTDTGNPFVVPGYSVHEELALFVRAGMTPYEALSAATRRAAEFLSTNEFGTIAVGKRADLLLVEGNPLVDVREADRIAGVMVRGRWLGAVELSALLATVEDAARGNRDPFAQMPPIVVEGRAEFSGTFRITWGDVAFGAERVVVAASATGERAIHAQSFDPHEGQRGTMHLWPGKDARGERLLVESEGASGRGHAELTREGASVRGRAVLLPGAEASLDAPLEATATLSAHEFFAPRFMLVPALAKLAVDESFELHEGELSLGSTLAVRMKTLRAKRIADALTTRRFEIADGKKPPMVLSLDARGWPVLYEQEAFGAKLRFERMN